MQRIKIGKKGYQWLVVLSVAVLLSLYPLTASASHKVGIAQVNQNISMPAHLQMMVTMAECTNAPGPVITFEGVLTLSGLAVQLIFRNNDNPVGGPHEHVEESSVSTVVIPEGEAIQIPKQPVQGGVGGNPFIWIQFFDDDDNPLTSEIFLGRCVQGISDVSVDLLVPGIANALIAADCSNNPGPFITMDGELVLSGINAKLIFRNNDNPVGGPHENVQSLDVVIIPSGISIKFPKQPVQGGVGGNPFIWIRFLDGSGQPLTDEIFLGRCVQDF